MFRSSSNKQLLQLSFLYRCNRGSFAHILCRWHSGDIGRTLRNGIIGKDLVDTDWIK